MNLISDCPECGKHLSSNRMYCNCGWSISLKEEVHEFDDRCQYRSGQWRCSEIGSFGPRWVIGKWYCYDHWMEIKGHQNKY